MFEKSHSSVFALELICVALLGLILYIQYPLSSTFPIGGDASRYILDFLEVRDLAANGDIISAFFRFVRNTQYPLSQAVIDFSAIIPVAWPVKFIWLMALGQIAVGLSITYVLYRIKNIRAGIYGFFAWSLSVSQITGHIQDATLAQLLSLVPLIFFLYALLQKHWVTAIALGLASFLFHPLTGIVAAMTYLIFIAVLLADYKNLAGKDRKFISLNLYMLPALGVSALMLFWYKFSYFSAITVGEHSFSLPNILVSPFGLFALLIPFGLFFLPNNTKEDRLRAFVLISFCISAVFLAFNDFLHINVMPYRFETYFILAATLLSSIALPDIFKSLFNTKAWIAMLVLALSLTASSWHENGPVFAFYESPGKYARLHPDEKEAIVWIKNNSEPSDIVLSTRENRHSEWIPIIGNIKWIGVVNHKEPWHLHGAEFQQWLDAHDVRYVVIFKNREKSKDILGDNKQLLHVVFENKGAEIYEIIR